MAGYSRIYCVGGRGGYRGSDGINPMLFQILVGDADRQWLDVHYFDAAMRPIGRIHTIVPESPDQPDMLLDACIAFYPDFFREIPFLPVIRQRLEGVERLDFNAGSIPREWSEMRSLARPFFRRLSIYRARSVAYSGLNRYERHLNIHAEVRR